MSISDKSLDEATERAFQKSIEIKLSTRERRLVEAAQRYRKCREGMQTNGSQNATEQKESSEQLKDALQAYEGVI